MPETVQQTTKQLTDERIYYPSGKPIKALGEDRIGGYLVVFGDPDKRDMQGEYFTKDTDFHLDWYEKRPALFHHGLDKTMKGAKVGDITALHMDEIGLWAEGILDMRSAYIQKLKELIDRGVIGWSSGALPQRAVLEGDGRISEWGIIEGSLTPTPAEPRRTNIHMIKTAFAALEERLTAPEEPPSEAAKVAEENTADNADVTPKPTIKRKRGIKNMPELSALLSAMEEAGISAEQQLQIVNAVGGGAEPEPEAPEEEAPPPDGMMSAPPTAKTMTPAQMYAIIQKANEREQAARKTAPATEALPAAGNGAGSASAPRIRVTTRYDRMPLEDLTFVKSIMDAASRAQGLGPNWSPADENDARSFWGNVAAKAIQAQQNGSVQFSERAVKALNAYKSNELNYSTLASGGDEFVWEGWSNQLWRKPRIDNVVSANLTWIDMPANPYKLPIESTDPTVVAVPETTNEDQLTLDNSSSPIADSKVATSNTTATARKLGLRVGVSEELNEDSIIPVASLWREQAVRAMEDARDNVILNADDTNANTNINTDGSPAATDKFLYGGGDGILHLPIIDNTALAVNAGGAEITLSMLRQARAKLNRHMISKLGELIYFVDPLLYVKLQSMDELLVQSINGRGSTVETGEVGKIDNIPVFVSNEIASSASNGKVSATAGNNLYGRIVLVHKPSWYPCRRREIRTTFDYMAVYDAWQLVVTMRMALVRRSTDCATLVYGASIS